MTLPPVTPGMALVFAVVLGTLVLFATEVVPVDVTALGVMVTLLLIEPVSGLLADAGLIAGPVTVLPPAPAGPVSVVPGLSGFASSATITVLAMFVLSAGVQHTGAIQILGAKVAALTGDSETRQLGATVGIVGPISGFINNTAAVAILLPMVTDLAHENDVSPSTLLLPLSYLTEVVVREDSPLVGQTVRQALYETDLDVDLVQLVRGEETFLEPLGQKTISAGDVFALRTDRDTLVGLLDAEGLDLVPEAELDEAALETEAAPRTLVGQTLGTATFRQHYDATVLALRRGGEVVRQRMDRLRLRVGDTLLVQGPAESIDRLNADGDFIVAQEVERPDFRESRIPVAVGIVAGVVAVAAVTEISIVVSALAGALAMVLTGCLRPPEVYEAVQWDVVFLLAGVIPLGLALEATGGAALIAEAIVQVAPSLSPLLVLGLVYVVTALLTNVISNNASVVLLVPVAAEAAVGIGASPLPFVLAVTFAASTAFMTPVGYQTNLFVYGPGGYRFTDYLRVGGPLQAIVGVVTTVGIAHFWELTPA